MSLDRAAEYLKWRSAFAEAMDPRYWPIDWLDMAVAEGRVALLASEHSAVVAEVKNYPSGARDIHVLVAAGDLENLRTEMIDRLIEMAKLTGSLAVLIESRPGWARTLKTRGFEQFQVGLRKEI